MKLKTLFYGFRHGHVYGVYHKIINSDSFEVVGCVEENDVARHDAQEKLGILFSNVDYETWLTRDVDVVVIGGAYADRGEAVIRALEAGKHVIADKPICTELAQWERISVLCRQSNLHLQCMLDLRYLPQTIEAQKQIRSGKLGAVRNISFQGQHVLNYGTRPGWYFEPGMHGGTINDLAIHGIDLVRMITGMEFVGVDAARTWNAYAAKAPHFNDCAVFMARMENGAGVMADISYSAPEYGGEMPTYWEFRFWCDQGLLTFCFGSNCVTIYKKGEAAPKVITCKGIGFDYVTEFLDALSSSDSTMTKNVLQSSKVALLLQKHAEERNAYAEI